MSRDLGLISPLLSFITWKFNPRLLQKCKVFCYIFLKDLPRAAYLLHPHFGKVVYQKIPFPKNVWTWNIVKIAFQSNNFFQQRNESMNMTSSCIIKPVNNKKESWCKSIRLAMTGWSLCQVKEKLNLLLLVFLLFDRKVGMTFIIISFYVS